MGVTIKQIAELAGVSRGTVDRAIHGRGDVNPETKEKIERVMRETGYRPNAVAKALKAVQNPVTLDVLVPSSPFYADLLRGVRAAEEFYAPYGVRLRVAERFELNGAAQAAVLRKLSEEHTDGIIMAALDVPAVREAVSCAAEKVPVITCNSDLTGVKRLCFVGQDHFAAGRVSGTLMGKMLPQGGEVAVVPGSRDMLAHMQRAAGFRQALQEQGGYELLLDVRETGESDKRAYEVVKELLDSRKNLAGICMTGGGQAGAGAALADSGRAGEIRLACYDTLPGTVEHIKNGTADYTIAQDPFLQGCLPVKLMYEYLALGKEPGRERIFTRIDIRVKDNVEDQEYDMFTGEDR